MTRATVTSDSRTPDIRAAELRAGSEAGFTLIEMVTALGVFSIGAVGLMHVMSQNAQATSALRERAFAAVVADNQLAAAFDPSLQLDVGAISGVEEAAGVAWTWTRIVTPSGDPALVRVEVQVRAPASGRIAASAISLRAIDDLQGAP